MDRLKLDPSDPSHADFIERWFELYEENGGEVEDSDEPSDKPVDDPVEPCDDDELILVAISEWYQGAKKVDGKWVSDWLPGDDPMVDLFWPNRTGR